MAARRSPCRRPVRRRWALAATLPWATWALLRATGSERGFPLVPAVSFTPYAAATSVLPLALAVRAGAGAAALLAAGSAAALAGAVLIRAVPAGEVPAGEVPAGEVPAGEVPVPRPRRRPTRPEPAGHALRVATVSLRRGKVRPGPVLDLVRRHDVDVLAVQELTPQAEAALRRAGIDGLLPYAHVLPARPGRVASASGAVWSRVPVTERAEVRGGFEQPTVRLAPEGAEAVELTSVHSVPPATSPAAVRSWARDLAELPGPAPGVLRVLAGDFNATSDHAALRAVLALGSVAAARAAGRGLAWTWRPLHLRFPRLALDHVLVDPRVAVAAVHVVPVSGSDHRAVVAELVLPAAGRPAHVHRSASVGTAVRSGAHPRALR